MRVRRAVIVDYEGLNIIRFVGSGIVLVTFRLSVLGTGILLGVNILRIIMKLVKLSVRLNLRKHTVAWQQRRVRNVIWTRLAFIIL